MNERTLIYIFLIGIAFVEMLIVFDLERRLRKYVHLCSSYAGKIAALNRENCELKQQIQLEIADNADLKRQLETVRNTNKLLSLDLDSVQEENRKIKEFNTIIQYEYNNIRKKTTK